MKTFQKALAIGVLTVISGYAMQVAAAPIFSFTEYGGFTDDVAIAQYTNLVVGAPSVVPAATPIYSTMSWNENVFPQSSLVLSTVQSPTALAINTWTRISTLTHNNVLITNAANWGPQDIWGRLRITDSDGASSVRLDSDEAITIALTETTNVAPCPAPNPVSTTCDDFFSFTAAGLTPLLFTANDGSAWQASFRFANLVNAVMIDDTIYTGEARSSSLDVEVQLTQIRTVPEPATLGIFGLGLLGLGLAKRRKLNG